MIERYTRPEMGHIFSLENKYRIWQEIEVLACEAQAELGYIGLSKQEASWIREHAAFSLERVDELEAQTNHDVIAFLTCLGEYVDKDADPQKPKPSRWIHYGMTSSDLGDTALCYQLTQASDLLLCALKALVELCKKRAFETKDVLCVGRTHGIHAEPMLFGMKFASWAWEFKRAYERLSLARADIAKGAISGAVGTYSSIEPFVEEYVCKHMGLEVEPLSTQIIARDHHAALQGALAVLACSLERVATEIRAHQKSESLELEEPFKQGQKGSSAMPHKRNPITAERICGLARIVKANAQVAFDNVALWHERDISHSSAERVALVDSFIALDYMLHKMNWLIEGLKIYPECMRANLNKTGGVIYSSKALLALVDSGLSREEAYAIVQENSMKVWQEIQEGNRSLSLRSLLEEDERVDLSSEQLDKIFDPWQFLQRSQTVFDRLEELSF